LPLGKWGVRQNAYNGAFCGAGFLLGGEGENKGVSEGEGSEHRR